MRKTAIRISALALMFVMVLSLTPVARISAASADSAYKNYIKKLSGNTKVEYVDGYKYDYLATGKWKTSKKSINLKKFKYYNIVNVTGDAQKELLLSTSKIGCSMDAKVLICTYSKGKVVPVFCVAGLRTGLFKAKNKQLVFGFGGSDNASKVFMRLQGTKLKHQSTYSVIANKPGYTYYNGKKKISESSYRKKVNTINKTPISFKKIKG